MRIGALVVLALFTGAALCGCRGQSPPPEPAAATSSVGASKCAGKTAYKMQEPSGGGCGAGLKRGCGAGR